MDPSQLVLEVGKVFFALTSAIAIPGIGLWLAARYVRGKRNSDRP